MIRRTKPVEESTFVPFKMHPRVFGAIGADLVTSDIVAIMELVKNSYDAFSTEVFVRLKTDRNLPEPNNDIVSIEILDNGSGMDLQTIDDVWCMIATPFRENHPLMEEMLSTERRTRRVTGSKGLGRLSAARLGCSLTFITKTKDKTPWKVSVNWKDIATSNDISECGITRAPYLRDTSRIFPNGSGTRMRISELNSAWTRDEVNDLKDALSRFISPVKQKDSFSVSLSDPYSENKDMQIAVSQFNSTPPYSCTGTFTENGSLTFDYKFHPLSSDSVKQRSSSFPWDLLREDLFKSTRIPVPEKPICGPFSFEIMAWDLDRESFAEAEKKYNKKRSSLRDEIRRFKGISLYRDGVLVLPKTEKAKDWLGLDLRRVSRVGARLSTSQIIGYVSIGADSNPRIRDTSDRERLAKTDESELFERILQAIVSRLESEREKDKGSTEKEPALHSLFESLSPDTLLREIRTDVEQQRPVSQMLSRVEEFAKSSNQAIKSIERRFTYLSKLANLGTIADLLVHEIGNHCGIIDVFLAKISKLVLGSNDGTLEKLQELATLGVRALQRLGQVFRPVAARNFKRGKRSSKIEDILEAVTEALSEKIRANGVTLEVDIEDDFEISIDPGELYPVLFNLLDNSLYWLLYTEKENRKITVKAWEESGQVICTVSDTGPGVDESDQEIIFDPGVTRKPDGLGMGLTIAGEIMDENDGQLSLLTPGFSSGATFELKFHSAQVFL